MTGDIPTVTGMSKLYRGMLQSQQAFLPSGEIARWLIRAGGRVLDAQIAYTQALMSANAAFLAAWKNEPFTEEAVRTSVAVKQNEVMAA